jgi:hypothetical protein
MPVTSHPLSRRLLGLGLMAAALAGCTSVPLDVPTPAPRPPAPREPQLSAFSTRLDGRNQVPPVASMGTGTLDAVLDKNTGLLRWRLAYSNLSGPVTAAHFHGPALIGMNAPPVITIDASPNRAPEGRANLTPSQQAELLAGRWYVNLHTARYPDGELRGQLIERR